MKEEKKILIADPSTRLIDSILTADEGKEYLFAVAKSGPATLKKIQEFHPDLIVMDLMMSHIHALEIMKTLKASPQYHQIGIIITTHHVMVQNYHAVLDEGADYFLMKPFTLPKLFSLIEAFFKGELKPAPFSLRNGPNTLQNHCYHPTPSILTSYLKFWGTRGSNPVSGADYVRYGGNTSCLEVRNGKDLIIIDAGTGIQPLGDLIHHEGFQTIHLFLSHTHWDHITGFPFFAPLYKKANEIVIWAPVGFDKSTKDLFNGMLAYAYFPVRLDEMKAKVTFRELRDDHPLTFGSLKVECHYTNHPGPTVGFKIRAPHKTIGYITDNEVLLGYHGHPNKIHRKHPLLEPHLSLIEFLKDCDLLIHEAQYFPEEYYKKIGWGHSSLPNATVLVKYSGVKEWLITHHDPHHKDADLQVKLQLHHDVIEECGLSLNVDIAYDGLMIPL